MKEVSMEKVQGYFQMLDDNKRLLYNSMNEEQYRKAKDFEKHILSIINDLIVPTPIVN